MRGLLILSLTQLLYVPTASQAAAIHDAAKKGDVAAIAAALDSGAGVDESDGAATPLFFAVKRGRADAAKFLLERGADVNAPTNWGPALMAAVAKSKFDLVSLLLAHGANPNSDFDGEAALHVAARLGCLPCVTALVEAGADVNARTHEGKTPIHLAKSNGHDDVAGYLTAHGVILPVPQPISAKLASADVDKGKSTFGAECSSCHDIAPGSVQKAGPILSGVVGRAKASLDKVNYSEALLAWGGVWTYEDLNVYLSGPMLTTPGVFMETAGVPDEAARVNVIAYLRTLSDNPVPLP